MVQVTLVALYGEKTSDFAALIAQVQQAVTDIAGSAFERYDAGQIHGTIVGLERRIPSSRVNANYSRLRGVEVRMNFGGYLGFLRSSGLVPFEVQLGGFAPGDYPFTSRNTQPYERTFSVQGDKVVLMGWPLRGTPVTSLPQTPAALSQATHVYPRTLDELRHAAERFGILHAYHKQLTDVDNDLFFRIGLIDAGKLKPGMLDALHGSVRQQMSSRLTVIQVRLDDIFVVAYEDDKLPLGSTMAWSIADPAIDDSFIVGLFR